MNQQTAQWLLDRSFELAALSECKKRQFGAVIVNSRVLRGRYERRRDVYDLIVAYGVNHPYDYKACEPCLRESIPSGTRMELCRAVHAEQAAVVEFLRRPADEESYSIVVNGREGDRRIYNGQAGFYCTLCARLLNEVEIESVIVLTKDGPAELSMQAALDSAYAVAKGKADADTHTFHE